MAKTTMAFALQQRRLLTSSRNRSPPFLLAHMNYARLVAPMDHPDMSEFRHAMDPINAIARQTPGFVWSLNDVRQEDRNSVPMLRNDSLLMPQLSLWTNAAAIQHFAFKSGHAMYLKRKREWFTSAPSSSPFSVCWWRCSTLDHPTLYEAFEKLHHLRLHGPTEHAFDLKTAKQFPMPQEEGEC